MVLLTEIVSWADRYRRLDALQHFVWEKLNTGHWKDVSLEWRNIFALISLLKVESIAEFADKDDDVVKDVVKMCDVALLMGNPNFLGGACSKIATDICQTFLDADNGETKRRKLMKPSRLKTPRRAESVNEINFVEDVDVVDFADGFFGREQPVIIKGALTSWPAFTRWSVDFFRLNHGHRSVPVEIGSRYTDPDWTQTIMTIEELIERFDDDDRKVYLAQHQLLEQIPTLKADLGTPEFCLCGEEDDVEVNLWFGPAGTVSPLHTDPKHNILCQIFGEKYVRLYPETESPKIYPFEGDPLLFNTSRVDVENVDTDAFPLFENARGFEGIMSAGDALYIPPRCWHFVKSLSPSCSVSFWFQ